MHYFSLKLEFHLADAKAVSFAVKSNVSYLQEGRQISQVHAFSAITIALLILSALFDTSDEWKSEDETLLFV